MKKINKILVENYISKNNGKIVFVGMTAEIPDPDYKFFIKLEDFTSTYKRLLLRELHKIITNEKKIKKHILEENDPREIDVQRFGDMSLMFPVDYMSFRKDYKERLDGAKKKGYVPKTQEQFNK